MTQKVSDLLLLTRRELIALLLVFAASLPAVTPRLYSSDEVQYFSYLRSLWFDRDVSFENEYRHFYDRGIAQTPAFHETFLERTTPTGRRINFGTIGSAILWAPFYGVADAGTRIMRRFGSQVPADGFSTPYVAAVAYGSAFYGFLAVLLGIAAARRIVGADGAAAGVIVWFGTPLLFYMYVAPPYSHACSAFAVALVVTIWLRVRGTWSAGGAAALGLAGALAAMVREQDVLVLIGPAVDFGISALRDRRREPSRWLAAAAAGAGAFAFGLLPQLVAYQALNGRPGPSGYVTRKMLWHSPHALQVLFDPHHGFFFWTPLALLAIAGLTLFAWRQRDADRRRMAAVALLMIASQVYVSGAVDSWSVAGAFGQRRFVGLSSLLIVGLAAAWRLATQGSEADRAVPPGGTPRRYRRAAFATVAALCIWWNLALIALFAARLMDRQRIEPARNAYDAFVTLPRMAPALAWRYLAERSSFYERREPEPR